MSSAPSMTWLLVRTSPLELIRNPLPSPLAILSRGLPQPYCIPRCSTCAVNTLTTEGRIRRTSGANEPGEFGNGPPVGATATRPPSTSAAAAAGDGAAAASAVVPGGAVLKAVVGGGAGAVAWPGEP